MKRQKFMTMAEIGEILNAESSDDDDDDDDGEYMRDNVVNVLYVPPPVDFLSDEEDFDENIIDVHADPQVEIAGEVEIEYLSKTEEPQESSEAEPQAGPSKVLKKFKSLTDFGEAKWRKTDEIVYQRQPLHTPLDGVVKSMVAELGKFKIHCLKYKCKS